MSNNLHFLILFGLFFLKLIKITLNNFYLIHNRLYHMMSRFLSTNFTRDATRINGSNVNFPYYKSTKRIVKHFKAYFLCIQRMRLWHMFKKTRKVFDIYLILKNISFSIYSHILSNRCFRNKNEYNIEKLMEKEGNRVSRIEISNTK